jgi:O-antigen/teichoic acid export membrane protein
MHWATIRSMMGFGTYASGSRILYNLYINADYLIVGKVFSGEVLGIYTFAYKVISDPARALATIVNRVAYPAFARLQDDRARLERYFFAVARASLSLIGVLLVVVAVYIDETLILFDYQQWRPAVPLIRTFAVVGLMQAVAPIVPQMLNAVGRARNNFWYSVATAVVMPAAFLIGSRYGVSGVAAGWAIAYPLVVLVLFQYGARVFDMGLVRFTVRLLAGLLVVVPTACFALLAQWLLQRFWLGEGPAVLLGALATLLLGGGLAYLRERETLRRIRGG